MVHAKWPYAKRVFSYPDLNRLKKQKKNKKKKTADRVNKDLFPHLKGGVGLLLILIFVSVTSWDPHWRVSNSKGYFPLARRNPEYMRKRPKPI